MRKLGFVLAFLWVATSTQGQSCPVDDPESFGYASEESKLHGTLVYHDELRQWLGLKLDRPVCGQTEIQLVFVRGDVGGEWRKTEALQGCGVEARGTLYQSPTGHYSTDLAIADAKLNPDPSCHPLPLKPDLSASPIPKNVQTYSASITVDYRGKGHVEVAIWHGEKKALLKPWQAYVRYMLTGDAALIWFGCREGFSINHVAQQPPADHPLQYEPPDQTGAVLDPDSINTVMFSCQKESIIPK